MGVAWLVCLVPVDGDFRILPLRNTPPSAVARRNSSSQATLNFLRLVDQFVCLRSNCLSPDHAAAVISEVLRQSTSLTSTPPLRPSTSWNINRSPSLWYLVTS